MANQMRVTLSFPQIIMLLEFLGESPDDPEAMRIATRIAKAVGPRMRASDRWRPVWDEFLRRNDPPTQGD